ncbi:uncharacterized protein DNG_04810 [Cephalotrichum gorgonifer]|uniref:Uncharacterized protein n=1 Tax=Cephalotrichum gorgonifer TaxID=2041049 RepID=A0AAE8MX51_9PEZI|nr:uncharacterized protein DNG_04810 [Cephalotrichum gorgonifer]
MKIPSAAGCAAASTQHQAVHRYPGATSSLRVRLAGFALNAPAQGDRVWLVVNAIGRV